MDRTFNHVSSRKSSHNSLHSIPASSASSNQNSDDDDSDTISLAVTYKERRREAHTQAEQKRRDAIRVSFTFNRFIKNRNININVSLSDLSMGNFLFDENACALGYLRKMLLKSKFFYLIINLRVLLCNVKMFLSQLSFFPARLRRASILGMSSG